jgi:hypothetical protein
LCFLLATQLNMRWLLSAFLNPPLYVVFIL